MSDLVWGKPSPRHCRTCDRAAVRTGDILLQLGLAEFCWALFWPWRSLELGWMPPYWTTSLICHYFKDEHKILPLFLFCSLEAVNVLGVWDGDTGSKMSTDLPMLRLSMHLEVVRKRGIQTLDWFVFDLQGGGILVWVFFWWKNGFTWQCKHKACAISISMLCRIFLPKFFLKKSNYCVISNC